MKPIVNFVFDEPLHGEDAPAVANEKYLVICDGMGGGGQNRHEINGEVRSSAYFGSRLLSSVCTKYYEENYDLICENFLSNPNEPVERLKELIKKEFNDYVAKYSLKKTVRGKMIKMLPTTLSSIVFRRTGDGFTDAFVINAGDTRAFVITPEKGLQQLSTDDVDSDVDAFEKSTMITNNISQDCDFVLHFAHYRLPEPCVIFACSDGCYDYIQTPMEFEYYIEANIIKKFSEENAFGKELGEFFKKKTGLQDDCSFAAALLGCEDFDSFKTALTKRALFVENEYLRKFNEIDKEAASSPSVNDSQLSALEAELKDSEKQFRASLQNKVQKALRNIAADKSGVTDVSGSAIYHALKNSALGSELRGRVEDAQRKHSEEKDRLRGEYENLHNKLKERFNELWMRSSAPSFDPYAEIKKRSSIYSHSKREQEIILNDLNNNYNADLKECRERFVSELFKFRKASAYFTEDINSDEDLSSPFDQNMMDRLDSFYNAAKTLHELNIRQAFYGSGTMYGNGGDYPETMPQYPPAKSREPSPEVWRKAWRTGFSAYRNRAEFADVISDYKECKKLQSKLENIDSTDPGAECDKLADAFFTEKRIDIFNHLKNSVSEEKLLGEAEYKAYLSKKEKYEKLSEDSTKFVKKRLALWAQYKDCYELFKHTDNGGVV